MGSENYFSLYIKFTFRPHWQIFIYKKQIIIIYIYINVLGKQNDGRLIKNLPVA